MPLIDPALPKDSTKQGETCALTKEPAAPFLDVLRASLRESARAERPAELSGAVTTSAYRAHSSDFTWLAGAGLAGMGPFGSGCQ